MMLKSRFKWVVVLLLLNGVIIELDNAYKQAMGISNIVMPNAPLLHLPREVHNSRVTEHPVFRNFDGMTLTSGTVIFYD